MTCVFRASPTYLSRASVLACFVAVLTSSSALRLERGSISSGGVAQHPEQATVVECPWGSIRAHGATAREDEHTAQEVCAPEVVDWQFEHELFKNRSNAARTAPPSDAENDDQMHEAVRALKQKPHQPHIVFIGDSIMVEQYFNLASWLVHGEARPLEPKTQPSGIKIVTFQDLFRAAFSYQNKQLKGDGVSEICHCGRDGRDGNTHDFGNFVQDRFIALPGNGSSISYFGWFGGQSFHGFFNPPDERPTQASCQIGKCTSPFRWTIKQPEWQKGLGVVNLLSSVVAKLQPKPTHVVINSGKWGHLNSRGLHNLFAAGAKIQKRDGTRFVWKTVTHSKSDTNNNRQALVNMETNLAREYGWDVFDAYNLTRHFPRDLYKDDMHFQDRVATHLNRMFLEDVSRSLL